MSLENYFKMIENCYAESKWYKCLACKSAMKFHCIRHNHISNTRKFFKEKVNDFISYMNKRYGKCKLNNLECYRCIESRCQYNKSDRAIKIKRQVANSRRKKSRYLYWINKCYKTLGVIECVGCNIKKCPHFKKSTAHIKWDEVSWEYKLYMLSQITYEEFIDRLKSYAILHKIFDSFEDLAFFEGIADILIERKKIAKKYLLSKKAKPHLIPVTDLIPADELDKMIEDHERQIWEGL